MVSAQTRPERPPRVPIGTLVEWVRELGGLNSFLVYDNTQITGITLSSQRTRPGDLYVALAGSRSHGMDFADQARAAGAVAILTDPDGRQRGLALSLIHI